MKIQKNLEFHSFLMNLRENSSENTDQSGHRWEEKHQPKLYYVLSLVISSLLFDEMMFKHAVSFAVLQSSEKKETNHYKTLLPMAASSIFIIVNERDCNEIRRS